jgi:hypothetical protein
VFVICRSEGNIDIRRFHNPPVDGRGATYAKWQASYKRYLASEYGFKGSNLGYGKVSDAGGRAERVRRVGRECSRAADDQWTGVAARRSGNFDMYLPLSLAAKNR